MTLVALVHYTSAYEGLQNAADAARIERDRAIVAAHTEGHTHHAIAEATGLTRGRVGQIVNARKDKP